jgi:hypothetical protein
MQHKWQKSYVCCLYHRHITERFGTKFSFCDELFVGRCCTSLCTDVSVTVSEEVNPYCCPRRRFIYEAVECWSMLCNENLPLSLSPFPTLQYRASVKCFVSLQFLNPKTASRTPWTRDQPVERPLPIQTQNKHRHKHACLDWDSNPWCQRSRGRTQFMS